MSFDQSLWLLALVPLVAATVVVDAWGLSAVAARQRRWALWVRVGLVCLLVFALAGFRLGSGGDRVAVVFLVDRSDSVGQGGTDRATDFVAEALRARKRGDLVSVVAFGKEPRLEFGMTDHPEIQRIAATPNPGATDLSRALRLAAGLFPEGTKRRIVVLSDGRETRGDARREAERLAREGIAIEGMTLDARSGGDALIESLDAPARARKGESYRVAATLRSQGGPAHLDFYRDGALFNSRDFTLTPGRQTIVLNEKAGAAGVHRYEARLRAATDAVAENNRATAAVIVDGPPRVLLIEGEPGEAGSLARALRAGALRVDVRAPQDLPALEDLLAYQSTVLVDVPASELRADQVAELKTAVGDAGTGLLTIGGEDSYGLGGYRGSPLEALLPVDSDIRDPKRRPSVAEAIVVDTSGSMAACHCTGTGPRGFGPGGINKTDISRAGAASAIRALTENDIVGVLAFNTESKWVVPLQKLPPEDVVRSGLASMHPAGGTNIPQALNSAVAELRQTKAKLKHIILFTDGWTNQEALLAVARSVAKAGITLSVVATGEGTGDVLARMAEAGRGRFYAGTNLTEVPQVITQEAILASRNFINEGVFSPVIAADTPVTESLTAAPALLGYIATTAKPGATVDLSVGSDDPLFATWRAGLGVVSSWTSDAKARWAKPWIGWNGFRDFWTRAVRSTFAPSAGGGFAIEARTVGDRVRIDVASVRALSAGATATARIIDPSLAATELVLDRAGPGAFRGDVPAGAEGTYLILATVHDGNALLYRDHVATSLAYSAEYLAIGADASMIGDLARATGARASITARQTFDRAGLRTSRARRELWPLLALLAALLLPVDVAIRRLVLSREDLRKARTTIRAWRPPLFRRGPAGPREERIDRLMEAKQRARDRSHRE